MEKHPEPGKRDDESDSYGPERAESSTSRRRLLQGVGVAGLGLGLAGFAAQQKSTTFVFDGEVEAWQGQSPESILGANPTLPLQAGQEYTVEWENVDGQPHNFVILDANEEQLLRTEIITEQGATQSVTFTATEEMATYLCEVHPTTMVGDIEVTGSSTGTGTATEDATTEQGAGAGFFSPGAEVGLEVVAEGMTAPTDHALPGDDSGRQFVADQTGEVWTITEEGRSETPFIDVSDRMVDVGGGESADSVSYDERGLLGIDFHPEFADNGRFYLHYSAPANEETPDGWDHVGVVSEFTATEDRSAGDPDSERTILELQQPQFNHNGGPMAFGPDGYLYVPTGDGGGANDEGPGHVQDWYSPNAGGNGQDVFENLLGDVLRIDVDSESGDQPYGIPEDNPFVDTSAREEIYAYGFRNPYGISFDSAGNCFVADAGQNLFEEANVVEAGGNYGWNVKEGTHCFSTDSPSDPAAITDCPSTGPAEPPYNGDPLIDPVVEFPHTYEGTGVGITIIGGHRYEASTIPELAGKYVFGTWTRGTSGPAPEGRIFAATPPEGFDTGGETGTGDDMAGNETAENDTTGNETAGNDTIGNDTAGNETAANGGMNGTATATPADGDSGADPGAVPVEDLWEMEEVVVSGEFPYFVRMFGQTADGGVAVLASQNPVPDGDTGVLLAIVPPGDGDTTGTATEAPNGTMTEAPNGTTGNESQ
ncbi:hypothetical protein JCM30237_25070 [Halolamina litorea]|uniref:PQQ-dependent sugar dehydrogenase n=1 Tax=Halolamina litorea TaxID=1515593 RepID=A0ABD6BVQ5_9EURY|nr:PQQ-dependent sugar dehydrogenase [Halolamina litorea]